MEPQADSHIINARVSQMIQIKRLSDQIFGQIQMQMILNKDTFLPPLYLYHNRVMWGSIH